MNRSGMHLLLGPPRLDEALWTELGIEQDSEYPPALALGHHEYLEARFRAWTNAQILDSSQIAPKGKRKKTINKTIKSCFE